MVVRRDTKLLEALLVLYVIFFTAIFFMSMWIMDENSIQIGTMIVSVWTTAVSGLLIAVLTVRQWKTKNPLRITWTGLSLGLMTLAVSVFSFEMLIEVYVHVKIIVLIWSAGLIFLAGFICIIKEVASILRRA